MPEIYEHIQFQRETVINERRGKPLILQNLPGIKVHMHKN